MNIETKKTLFKRSLLLKEKIKFGKKITFVQINPLDLMLSIYASLILLEVKDHLANLQLISACEITSR